MKKESSSKEEKKHMKGGNVYGRKKDARLSSEEVGEKKYDKAL